MNFINRLKVKYELSVARGMLAEKMKKADWNMDNMNIIERRDAEKLIDIISKVEQDLKWH